MRGLNNAERQSTKSTDTQRPVVTMSLLHQFENSVYTSKFDERTTDRLEKIWDKTSATLMDLNDSLIDLLTEAVEPTRYSDYWQKTTFSRTQVTLNGDLKTLNLS